MSTRVIPKANTVRTSFHKTVATRVEKLVELATTSIDTKLRAHFEKALASGAEPYPPPNYAVSLVVLDADDFASGNYPEAQGAFENLAHGTPDGDKFTKTITQMLQNAGFQASVSIDARTKRVTINVSDPEFTQWAYNNNVELRAQETVQQTLQDRHQRQISARAKELAPAVVEPLKQALREGLKGLYWEDGFSQNVTVAALVPHAQDSDLIAAVCELASKQLSTKATSVEAYEYRSEHITVAVYFDSEQAFRGFVRSLEK